jgi:hypothetical protein
MNSQELRALQEAYMDVYGEEYRKLPHDKMIAKSNKFDKQYKTGPTKTDAEYKSTTDASRRRAGTFLTTRFHDPKQSQEKSAANKNRPESKKRSKTVSNEPKRFPNRLTRSDKQGIKDSYEYDLYDIILSHLLDEGYAETQEQAEVIMVNMSEDWRESICEGKVPWNDPKNPLQSGYTPKEKSEAKRRQLGVDDPNTSSFEKGGPGENEYARHANLAATQEKMKKRSNQPKGKPHQFRKNPFWKMDLGQVKRELFGTDVPKNKRSSYEGKNMPHFTKD